ncbi:MAG: ABC-2 family transporter protein [Gorillibacterium sp.]|nr:ABC-2 family transporter protein [Gorillibacterium sp.]
MKAEASVWKGRKYVAISRITVKNQLAYMTDFLLRTLFLLIIIYIFTQLWGATYRGEGSSTIAGYTFKQIMWYLIISESMTLATPSLALKIEQEVKSGEVGYKLIRPVNYIGFHYASYLGEVYFRLAVNLMAGLVLGMLILGPPAFGYGWLGLLVVSIGAFTVNFLLNMILALCAFWVEETQGLEFVYKKLLFTIGGMMMPLEVFPEALRKVCAWLPFQTVLYFPAKTVVSFDAVAMVRMVAIQGVWVLVLGICVLLIYRKGVSKLHVNGG